MKKSEDTIHPIPTTIKPFIKTHGMSKSGQYKTWYSMKERCQYPGHCAWGDYGGRGIKVCSRFAGSITEFYGDVGPRPSGHTLDRINTDGHYSCGKCAECIANGWPMNVRWATRESQQRNRRNNRMVTFRGQTKCLSEWAEILGMKWCTLYYRLFRHGWTVERAFTEPARMRLVSG